MLPYDNKNEFQVVVDMPEGATLEQTEAVTGELGRYLSGVAEVRDYQLYVGLASPMDFNGMVRHYFLRRGSNVADIRVNLAPKNRRSQQSHAMVLRIRDEMTKLASRRGREDQDGRGTARPTGSRNHRGRKFTAPPTPPWN